MSDSYKDKVAVITGAASGIGRGLAINLAAAGARLALSDIDLKGLEETRRLCGTATCRRYRVDYQDQPVGGGVRDQGHTTSPDEAARKILAGVARRKRRIIVSNGSRHARASCCSLK